MNLDPIIRACQSALGFTGPDVDGKAGPQTWAAIFEKLIGKAYQPDLIAGAPGFGADRADDRSEVLIATLLPEVRPYARALWHACDAEGIRIEVTSALRTYAEQDKLYAQGGVTKARGGYSNHNFGIAFDVTIFAAGEPVWESPTYRAIGALGKSLGLTWGGDWSSFQDEPHFEFRPPWAASLSESSMVAELRRRHDAGIPVFS